MQRQAREGRGRRRGRPLSDSARRCTGRHVWGMPGGPGTPPPRPGLFPITALVSSLMMQGCGHWQQVCFCHQEHLRCALPL